MQRVANSRNPAKDKFGAGKNGFQGGDLAAGQAATTPGFEWFDSMQEEVAGVIEAAGITLDATKFNQLYLAIKRIFIKSATLTDTGTANAYTAANSPPLVLNDIKPGLTQQVLIANANTGTSTYSPDGLRQDPIYGLGLQPLQGGELIAGATAILMSATIAGVNGGQPIWVLLECMGGAQQVPAGTKSQHAITLAQAQAIAATSLQSIAAAISSNALTLTWTPTGQQVQFRNPTLGNGSPVSSTLSAALSLTIPAGATLGSTNGQQSTFVWALVYNGGVPALAVANFSYGIDMSETGLISTAAISSASGLANTWYSANAIANSPYKIIGVTQQTEAVAGTYATAPSLVQPVGGEAYTSLGKFQTIIGAAVATTSGTSFLFSNIPSWAKNVKLLLNGVKTVSGSGLLVQAGSGSVQTSGYFSGSAGVSTGQASTTSYLNSTSGMCIYCAANTTHVGKMEFENQSGSSWIATHKVYGGVYTQVTEGAGNVTLSGQLDRINLTTIGGTDAFNAGSASLIIEG